MARLSITDAQGAVITALSASLDEAMADGISAPSDTTFLEGLTGYSSLNSEAKAQVKLVFQLVLAATVKILQIPTALPPTKFTGSIPGANTITVVDGIITGHTP